MKNKTSSAKEGCCSRSLGTRDRLHPVSVEFLADAGWGGTFTAVPNDAHINYVLVDDNETVAAKDWEPLVSFGGIQVNQSVFMVPTYFGPGCSDLTGSNEILASRLIPRSTLVNSPDKVAQGIVSVLTRQSNGTRKSVRGMDEDNALNAWRNATWHIAAMFGDVSDAIIPLRELTHESGTRVITTSLTGRGLSLEITTTGFLS